MCPVQVSQSSYLLLITQGCLLEICCCKWLKLSGTEKKNICLRLPFFNLIEYIFVFSDDETTCLMYYFYINLIECIALRGPEQWVSSISSVPLSKFIDVRITIKITFESCIHIYQQNTVVCFI